MGWGGRRGVSAGFKEGAGDPGRARPVWKAGEIPGGDRGRALREEGDDADGWARAGRGGARVLRLLRERARGVRSWAALARARALGRGEGRGRWARAEELGRRGKGEGREGRAGLGLGLLSGLGWIT